jgi:hypothetical protein
MSLNKTQLTAALKGIFDGVSPEATGQIDPEQLRQKIASEMADAIDAFVKSGTVTVASGIAVSTTGSATAQTGATTATGTGTIN